MNDLRGKEKAKNYYDQEAKDYIKQYNEDYNEYPANLIRIKFIIDRLNKTHAKRVLDAGCGTCGPMLRLIKEGFSVKGLDFAPEMVKEGKKELEKAGLDPDLVFLGDIENPDTLPKDKFDAVLALGVFPHIVDEKKALRNIHGVLNENGRTFIEFRNDLFAAFTLNKYSVDFFLNRVIRVDELPPDIKEEAIKYYSERLHVEKPTLRRDGKISYSEILARFRNPLSIEEELFTPNGFAIDKIHFYHYHALPPVFEKRFPKQFRELSFRIESTSDWRGYLMSSAFVVEARKKI